jgi:enterobactin synthetase component D
MSATPFIDKERWLALAPAVLSYACEYTLSAYHDGWFATLEVALPAALRHAVPKRKAEFLAGRHAAQRALAELGWPGWDIATAADRSPVWPDGVVGTITHTRHHALASVARRDQVQALGMDAELFLSQQLGAEVASMLVSDAETCYLRSLPMGFEQALTIVFSAKESLYKALHPEVKVFFDFSAAELLHLDRERGAFALRLRADLSTRWPAGAVIDGCYRLQDDHVLTYVVIPVT